MGKRGCAGWGKWEGEKIRDQLKRRGIIWRILGCWECMCDGIEGDPVARGEERRECTVRKVGKTGRKKSDIYGIFNEENY